MIPSACRGARPRGVGPRFERRARPNRPNLSPEPVPNSGRSTVAGSGAPSVQVLFIATAVPAIVETLLNREVLRRVCPGNKNRPWRLTCLAAARRRRASRLVSVDLPGFATLSICSPRLPERPSGTRRLSPEPVPNALPRLGAPRGVEPLSRFTLGKSGRNLAIRSVDAPTEVVDRLTTAKPSRVRARSGAAHETARPFAALARPQRVCRALRGRLHPRERRARSWRAIGSHRHR